jgi:uncharacterized protein DUF932
MRTRLTGMNRIYSPFLRPTEETQEQRAAYAFGVNERAVRFDSDKYPAPVAWDAFKVLVRKDNERPISVVSKGYVPVLHADVIDILDSEFAGHNITRRVAVERRGALMRAEYRFLDIVAEIRQKDFVNFSLHVANSFDTTTALTFQAGAFRLICSNGMIIGKVLAFLRAIHTWRVNLLNIVKNLDSAIKVFDNQGALWRNWAETPVNAQQVEQFLTSYAEEGGPVPKRYLSEIAVAFRGGEQTLWGFYNAITSVASHRARGINPALGLLRFANEAVNDIQIGS